MKIGIITQPLETNYGGLLQNYALQEALRRLGHEVTTLDQPYLIASRTKIIKETVKSIVKKLFGREAQIPVYISKEEIDAIAINTSDFVEKYIYHTKKISSKNDFRRITKELSLDALIVGSDQVWRPLYNPRLTRSFFDFAEDLNICRIAYAASFGTDDWEYTESQARTCSKLAKLFKAISVREKSGINICQERFGVDATFVLDPTMLLDKEDYIKIVENSGITKSEGDMFTYILDQTDKKKEFIKKVSTRLNLTPFSVMPHKNKQYIKKDIYNCIFPAVEQWLRAFIDAKFVVCDSFPGAVFSIIFNKPFVIIGNKERGMSRFNSLLNLYSLKDRLLDTTSNIDIVDKVIDWTKINEKRKEFKKTSIDFIKKNLR